MDNAEQLFGRPGRRETRMKNEPLRTTRTCAVCGKEFIFHRGAGWLYKRETCGKTIWFCGYKCWRRDELARGIK